MTGIEIAAVLLGVANIVLVIRRSVWNYPVGIAMVSLYAAIFFEVRLYSDALLQVFFLAANLYGWALWRRAAAASGDILVLRLGAPARMAWLGGALVVALVWGALMGRATDAALPYWDALVAVPSVAAQILMAKRRIENWWLWIGVNMVAIPLYATKGLALTASLYGVFLVLAVAGLLAWRRAALRQAAP